MSVVTDSSNTSSESSGSSTSMILTIESIPNYLKDNLELLGVSIDCNDIGMAVEDAIVKENGIEVTTIQGGNVNYAFCIKFPFLNGGNGNGKTVFLKQVRYGMLLYYIVLLTYVLN